MSVTGTVQTVGNTFNAPTPAPPTDFYAVLYVPQNLSPSQKTQAVANIGALTAANIQSLIANATFNTTTRILTFNRVDGTQYNFDLSQNVGVANIDFDVNNDLEVSFLDGSKKVITITNLLNGFVKTVNSKTGPHVVIDIDDIALLRLELDSRVPTGTTITVDGDTQNLQTNPVFTTKFTKAVFEHTLTASDVANTIMTFALTHTPKMDEWEFLFIGSAPVSPVSYSVSGNTLSIDTSTIGYPMQAGRLVIFRYMY